MLHTETSVQCINLPVVSNKPKFPAVLTSALSDHSCPSKSDSGARDLIALIDPDIDCCVT